MNYGRKVGVTIGVEALNCYVASSDVRLAVVVFVKLVVCLYGEICLSASGVAALSQ